MKNQTAVKSLASDPTKALLFSYKVYMDSQGNIHSGVSSVDPVELKKVLLTTNTNNNKGLTDEDAGVYVSAVNFLTAAVDDLDHQFEKHLRALA